MDYCIRMLDAGYAVRLGRSDIIKHYESPKRSFKRMDYYGRRNEVLFGWHNVPASYLPLYAARTVANTFRTAARVGRWRSMITGLGAGFRDCFRYYSARNPVRPDSYQLYRALRKNGPLRLRDIQDRLHAVDSDVNASIDPVQAA
jgi:hypothetical protein